ncbi:MAG: PilZ domain-containing protein [Deltaproteobacteria bacterium]|nr:PilZ domain-containing protein [Deltaproteobacteria bacterium]
MNVPPEGGPGRTLRTDRRHAIKTEFRLGESAGLGEIRLDTRDLSVGGAFLVADLLFEEGEVLSLSFTLPASARVVHTRGKVAWASRGDEEGKGAGMGIEFLDLGDEEQQELAAALADFEEAE